MGAWLLLVLIIAMGFVSVRAVWPAPSRWSSADPLRLALAPLAGLGLSSLLYFGVCIVGGGPAEGALGGVVVLAAAASWAAWHRGQHAVPDPQAPGGAAPMWLWILLGVTGALAGLTFLMLHLAAPHGEWDAWSIWNLRARFLFRGQEFASAFSPLLDWAHPDYPLLLPGVIALLWHAGAGESSGIVAAVALLFLVSAFAVPFCAVRLMRGQGIAIICTIAILGATTLVRVGVSLYADVPLAAFVVATGSLLAYSLLAPARGFSTAFLAGLCAGFAAWTKNEGLLFCGAAAIAFLFSVKSWKDLKTRLPLLPPLLAGMALVLAAVLYFKLRLAPPNDLVNSANASLATVRMTDFNRYWATFWAFVGELLMFGNVLVPPVIVFGVWLAMVRVRRELPGALLLPLLLVTVQLLGYFFVYVATPKDLDWQLSTSLPRLLLHVWPLAIVGIFLISGDIFGAEAQPERSEPRSK